VFYTEPEWAFGVIHYELTKYLFEHEVNATVLSWNINYNKQEIQELSDNIDYFVANPYGISLLIDKFGIAPEKCIVVAHAVRDLHHLNIFSPDNRKRLHNYGVVSDWLLEQSILLNIDRVPMVVPIGINYESFVSEPSTELKTIGYAGTISDTAIHKDIKRYWLIEEVSQKTNLGLKPAASYHNNYVTMQGYYKTVDAVIIASTEEGAGLPALEASAAGKLVISTPVGIWLSKSGNTGHTVSIDEKHFLNETEQLLTYYKDNPEEYRKKCLETQKHAKLYDWSNVIKYWVELVQ
jgi:glycosyltransferase involved in cell wall biosynthesis